MTAPYFSPSTSSNPIEYVVFKAALLIKGQVRGAEFWMKPKQGYHMARKDVQTNVCHFELLLTITEKFAEFTG